MANEIELKPCPCCNGKGKMYMPCIGDVLVGYRAGCSKRKKCGILTRLFDTPEEAAAAWNRRDGKAMAKGKWKNGTDYEYEFAYCSVCGRMQWAGWDSHQDAKEKVGNFHEEYKFCPGCGAAMEGGCYVE